MIDRYLPPIDLGYNSPTYDKDTPVLDYVALFLLVFASLTVFYGIIVIHDIPYEIAKHRNHPQQDAIHIAGWVSLLTLHVLWPFLWIWASLYRADRGWGFNNDNADTNPIATLEGQIATLQRRLEALEQNNQTAVSLEEKN